MTTKPQSTTEERLEPCPWCPTTRRETHETEAGTVGIIFHSEGCIFDGRQVLNPRGVKVWNTRVSPASAAPVVDVSALKKRARQIIDAVVKSPCVVEVRFFSQPEESEKLENEIAALIAPAAAATAAPQLHWPFAAKHQNCAECDKEYELPPAAAPVEQAEFPPKCKLCGHAGMLTKVDICTHHDLTKWDFLDQCDATRRDTLTDK